MSVGRPLRELIDPGARLPCPWRRRELIPGTAASFLVPPACGRWLSHAESNAAVDSELALLWHEGYDLRRWQLNLLYFQVPEELRKDKPPMVMTARIDGPNLALRGTVPGGCP